MGQRLGARVSIVVSASIVTENEDHAVRAHEAYARTNGELAREGINVNVGMSTVDDSEDPLDAEAVAKAFHETYERLAPQHQYETRRASAVPWEQVPANNRRLMVAVVADLIERGVIYT
jgi:tryptophan 2,3-dioxygenase